MNDKTKQEKLNQLQNEHNESIVEVMGQNLGN